MKLLRNVSEAEVLAEFLRAEFYQKQYDHDRESFEALVSDPDTTDQVANAVRKALLYRRRGHMWRELPSDTQWVEVQLGEEDMRNIKVFPRAQWRKISNGSFRLVDIVERIKQLPQNHKAGPVVSKIQLLRYRLQRERSNSSVLLIGIDKDHAMTILEGNHRLVAAMLISPNLAQNGFRVLCGFSPRMTESCWYYTNFPNLWRYVRNRLANLCDKEADVNRVLAEQPPAGIYPSPADAEGRPDTKQVSAATQDEDPMRMRA